MITSNDILLLSGIAAQIKLAKYEPKSKEYLMRRIEATIECLTPAGVALLEKQMETPSA